jgi:hypothetical protein
MGMTSSTGTLQYGVMSKQTGEDDWRIMIDLERPSIMTEFRIRVTNFLCSESACYMRCLNFFLIDAGDDPNFNVKPSQSGLYPG